MKLIYKLFLKCFSDSYATAKEPVWFTLVFQLPTFNPSNGGQPKDVAHPTRAV
jgi:hypothetical protein